MHFRLQMLFVYPVRQPDHSIVVVLGLPGLSSGWLMSGDGAPRRGARQLKLNSFDGSVKDHYQLLYLKESVSLQLFDWNRDSDTRANRRNTCMGF